MYREYYSKTVESFSGIGFDNLNTINSSGNAPNHSRIDEQMEEEIRRRLRKARIDAVVAKCVFLLVTIICIYLAVLQADHWWQSLLFLLLALFGGLLIDGGYDFIKINILERLGLEVSNDSKAKSTPQEIQNLLKDADSQNMTELEFDESEGKYRFQFDRE